MGRSLHTTKARAKIPTHVNHQQLSSPVLVLCLMLLIFLLFLHVPLLCLAPL